MAKPFSELRDMRPPVVAALAEATTPEEVMELLAANETAILKMYRLKVIAYAWTRVSSLTPLCFSSFRDRVPKQEGAIELWAKA